MKWLVDPTPILREKWNTVQQQTEAKKKREEL
jgi:hypothetical protein